MGHIELNIDNLSAEETQKYKEIFTTLAASGVLRLSGAQITLHLDARAIFQGIEVNFWPVRRVTKPEAPNELKPLNNINRLPLTDD